MEFSETMKLEILKKLSYKSKRPPSEKTCRTRLGFAVAIVSSIAKDPTSETVRLATEIVKHVQIYLKDAYFPSLDKLILKILNKVYNPELMQLIRHVEDPEIVAGICYIKFKYLSAIDERIFDVYHKISGDIKHKIEKLFGKDIVSRNTETANVENSDINNKDDRRENDCGIDSKSIRDDGKLNSSGRHVFYSIRSDSPRTTPAGMPKSVFARILSRKVLGGDFLIIWNDFSGYSKVKEASQETSMGLTGNLSLAISMLNECRLRDARAELLSLLGSPSTQEKLVVYSQLAYIHFLFLEFQESIFYLDLFLEIASGYDWEFGFNCKLFLERQAGFPSLAPFVTVEFFLDKTGDFAGRVDAEIARNFENKFLVRQMLSTSFQRISLYNRVYCSKECLARFFETVTKLVPGFAILFIFYHSDKLHIYNVEKILGADHPEECGGSCHLSIYWKDVVEEFEDIMAENQKVLSMNAVTAEDKKRWWSTRIRLDQNLGGVVRKLRGRINSSAKECESKRSGPGAELNISKRDSIMDSGGRLLLILEDSAAFFPFEAVFDKPAMRILSQDLSFHTSISDVRSMFYLLDPANNLQNTRSAIFGYFNSKNFCKDFLKGVIGRSLDPEEVRSLYKNEVFMYFGHGTGKKHFDVPDVMPKLLFLFGCSSCKLIHIQNFTSNGFCLRHIKKKRTLLGNLWDVTDKDLDKFTLAFLEDFLGGRDILESIFVNRNVCKLKFLNSAALVMYGIVSRSVKIVSK